MYAHINSIYMFINTYGFIIIFNFFVLLLIYIVALSTLFLINSIIWEWLYSEKYFTYRKAGWYYLFLAIFFCMATALGVFFGSHMYDQYIYFFGSKMYSLPQCINKICRGFETEIYQNITPRSLELISKAYFPLFKYPSSATIETARAFSELMNHLFETYGNNVSYANFLEFFKDFSPEVRAKYDALHNIKTSLPQISKIPKGSWLWR